MRFKNFEMGPFLFLDKGLRTRIPRYSHCHWHFNTKGLSNTVCGQIIVDHNSHLIMSQVPQILVLISGNGSNLQALIDSCISQKIQGNIKHVISSSSTAYGLTRASKASIPTSVFELKQYYKGIPKENKEERSVARSLFNQDLVKLILNDIKPDLIVCAGWMLILSPDFLKPLSDANIPIINLHPSLPGAFEGTHAIERSWKAGQDGEVTKGGVMIHYVIEEVDRGEPLIVREIDVIKGESCDDWEKRIHDLEHDAIVDGTVKVVQTIKK